MSKYKNLQIFEGTMIHSDQWGGYMHGAIAAIPVIPSYTHQSVNHTMHFVDPLTGAHEPRGKLLEKSKNEIQSNVWYR